MNITDSNLRYYSYVLKLKMFLSCNINAVYILNMFQVASDALLVNFIYCESRKSI